MTARDRASDTDSRHRFLASGLNQASLILRVMCVLLGTRSEPAQAAFSCVSLQVMSQVQGTLFFCYWGGHLQFACTLCFPEVVLTELQVVVTSIGSLASKWEVAFSSFSSARPSVRTPWKQLKARVVALNPNDPNGVLAGKTPRRRVRGTLWPPSAPRLQQGQLA